MRMSLILSMLLALLCCLGLAVETRAQAVTGYTSIDYYADADALDAYSETDLDWDLVGDYSAYVALAVIDDNSGSVISWQSARDYYDNGFISVESFIYGTTPGDTYTAVGAHKAFAELWDYSYEWPYGIWYYDDYYFTSFEGQNIFTPWWYQFFSPGWTSFRRRNQTITVGSTYDSDSVTTSGSDVEFVNVAVDDGTPVSFESGSDAQLEGAAYRANVNVSCGGEQFKVVVKFNLPQYSASCSAGNSRINVFSTSMFELTQNPAYGYSYRFFPDTSPPAAPSTSPPLAVAFVRRKADGSGSSNTLRVVVGGSYQSRDSYSTRANVHLICN